jgi:voltage-gated potassium channel Kch
MENSILIIGSGHLAFRLQTLLQQKKYDVVVTSIDIINEHKPYNSLLDNLSNYFATLRINKFEMVYLVDDNDEVNLQGILAFLTLYPNIPLTASMFNERLSLHVKQSHKNLIILNPAKIAAPLFVNAVDSDERIVEVNSGPTKVIKANKTIHFSLVQKLIFSFLLLLLTAVCFFHFYEKLSWINAFYFVIVTAAAVGYGDINLSNSSDVSKIAGVFLIVTSTISIWLIFSFSIDTMLKKRIQLALGRKKYDYRNHVIVCGLGRLGFFIVQELLSKGKKVIVIEKKEDNIHIEGVKALGAHVYIGDARQPKVLFDANAGAASAILVVINNDAINLEIGLNANVESVTSKIILRIFDEKIAKGLQNQFAIHQTLSASSIADEQFFQVLTKP